MNHFNRRDFIKLSALGTATSLLADRLPVFAQAPAPPNAQLKKAVLIGMLPGNLSYEDRFKLAQDVGFEGIEAMTVTDPQEAEKIRAAADKVKLRIHSVMNMDHWRYPLSSADPEVVAKSITGMETSLRNAKLWGADTVLLVPAVVNAQTSYRDAYTRSQEQIKKLIPLAQELGVVIAIEEVWNKFLLSPIEFARYVDEFNSPWIKAYFDVGNIVLFGFPEDWIRTLGKRIVKIHLKDFKREGSRFVALREGDINWPEVRKALGEIGYSGFMTTELGGGDEAYLREVSARVDKIIAGE